MGQILTRDEEPEVLLLGNGDDESTLDQVLPKIPPLSSTPALGLQECRQFLDSQLLQPLRYQRALAANPSGNEVYSFPSLKVVGLIGRSGMGKRSLVLDVCNANSIHVKVLSKPMDLVHFDFEATLSHFDNTYHAPKDEPAPKRSSLFFWRSTSNAPVVTPISKIPESWVLVIESNVIADHSGNLHGQDRSFLLAKLQHILSSFCQLPPSSTLIKIIFLLHDVHSIQTCQLNQFLNLRSATYARVPSYDDRKAIIYRSLNRFYDHDLMKRMNNLVNFSNNKVMNDLVNASAWYSPAEIISFLERCYSFVLVDLIKYAEMQNIPGQVPAIDLSQVFLDELETTKNAVLSHSALNQVPVHDKYGPRPYALDVQNIKEKSAPFENLFQLNLVDVEDNTWSHSLNPFLAKSQKRKLELVESEKQPPQNTITLIIPSMPSVPNKRPRLDGQPD